MPKKSLYLPDSIDAIIGVDAESGESYSGRASYLIALADLHARGAVPALSAGEWCALADAMNGHVSNYEAGPARVLRYAWHAVFDSAPDLDKKWAVDCAGLARRMLDMPLAAQAGALEVVRDFWRKGALVSAATDYAAAFTSLGARVAEKA